MKIKNRPSRDKHAEIIALYRAHPELTLKEIGERFGITGSGVSQIVSGRRGRRRQSRLERFSEDSVADREFVAIRLVIAALDGLDESARERVTQYAMAKLRDPATNSKSFPQDPGKE